MAGIGRTRSHNATRYCMLPCRDSHFNAGIPLIAAAWKTFRLMFSRTPKLLAHYENNESDERMHHDKNTPVNRP